MSDAIRIVSFKDGDLYVAQALEVDIAAQGRTAEEAIRKLKALFRAEKGEAEAEGREVWDIGPAPAPFHALFANEDVGRDKLVA